jgi:hypothetical protein
MPEIHDLVDELDRIVPREGARLKIPAEPDGAATVGTRLGYLRLGVELLRAGLSPLVETASGAPRIPLDIDYLLTPDSDPPFDVCEIDEGVERRPPSRKRLGAIGQLLAGVGVAAVLALLLLGLLAVLSRVFR